MAHQKMDMARGSGDERSRAFCLVKAGDALVQMGRPDEAMGYIMEAMGMAGEMKLEEVKAAATNIIAKVQTKKGRDEDELEEAMDSATDALKLFRKLGSRKGEAVALTSLASVYLASSKAAPAIQNAKEALAIFAELGEKKAMAATYDVVKSAYLAKKPAETFLAAKQVEKAMTLYKELGDKVKEASCMHTIGVIEKADVKKAAEKLHKAVELFTEAGDAAGRCGVMETIMEILLDNGLYYDAVNIGKERINVFRGVGDTAGEARAMLKLGDVYRKNGDHDRASKVGEACMGSFAAVNDMEGMKAAKDLMDGAKHDKDVEEMETSIAKVADQMHVPKYLLVDPGLNKRITSAFDSALTM